MATGAPPDNLLTASDDLGGNIIACAVITWIIAAIFVGLRFYTRGTIIRSLGPSDWCILVSLVWQETGLSGIAHWLTSACLLVLCFGCERVSRRS